MHYADTQQAKFTFTVRAVDGGNPSLHADVEVELNVVNRNNKPPVWEKISYGPIYVKESAPAGSDVVSVRARLVFFSKKNARTRVEKGSDNRD